MSCFLSLYILTSLLAFLRLERFNGRPTGRCDGCKYDLAGLAEHAVCPECGSRRREVTQGWSEIRGQWHPLLAWLPSLIVAAMLTLTPGPVEEFVWSLGQLFGGRKLSMQYVLVVPLDLAVLAAPLFARDANRGRGMLLVLALLVGGLIGSVLLNVW